MSCWAMIKVLAGGSGGEFISLPFTSSRSHPHALESCPFLHLHCHCHQMSIHLTNVCKVGYSFPAAAVTNYHRIGGFKQQKFILSQFCRPNMESQVHSAEIKTLSGPRSLWRLSGESVPWLFWFRVAVNVSWLEAASC